MCNSCGNSGDPIQIMCDSSGNSGDPIQINPQSTLTESWHFASARLLPIKTNPLSTECTIFKVPRDIRRCDENAYELEEVSIGLYQHNHLFGREGSPMHDFKWQCLRYLLLRLDSRNHKLLDDSLEQLKRRFESDQSEVVQHELLNDCLACVSSLVARVKVSYSDEDQKVSSMPRTEIARAMLLDGCFIIYLLLKQRRKGDPSDQNVQDRQVMIEEPVLGAIWKWHSVLYDLLKLENQIPFFVLDELFGLLKVQEIDGNVSLVGQALELFKVLQPGKAKNLEPPPPAKIHHLLHLFYVSILPPQQSRKLIIDKEDPSMLERIPSATELERSGIKFKRKQDPSSFLDVTFKNGVLEIPNLPIYDYTNSLLKNLIAFEQCYPHTDTQVTAYANFMNRIVHTARDVNLLDSKDIIVRSISNDEAVAVLFNNLCNQIHFSFDRNYLTPLYMEVKRYYGSTPRKVRAILMRDYLNNPWAIISVIAATILYY